MQGGIDAVQTVSQNCQSLQSVFQRSAMSTYIHTISQTAHNEQIRTQARQISHEAFNEVLAVVRHLTRSDNAQHAAALQSAFSGIKKDGRGIGDVFLSQKLRIVLRKIGQDFDASLLAKR